MIKKYTIKSVALIALVILCLSHVFPCVSFADSIETPGTVANSELKNAENKVKELLSTKKGDIESNSDFNKILDDATKKIVLQHYLIDALDDKAWPDFWDKIDEIAKAINNEENIHTFYDNVPEYVNEFIQVSVYNNGTVPEYENKKMFFSAYTADNVSGVLLYPARLLLLIVPSAIAQAVELSMTRIGSNEKLELSTIDEVIFNKVPVTDANIFKYKLGENTELTNGNVLYSLRESISGWYVAIRNLCIALSLAVLVYIGIRMAISSIADDKAKYKKMLKDWLVSFALIFILHYIMVGMLTLNDGLVKVLESAKEAQEKQIDEEIGLYVNIQKSIDSQGSTTKQEATTEKSIENRILEQAFSTSLTKGLLASLLYFLLNVMTFLYIIVYIKRLITISLLTMIAPIITITYPIDKVGDGKAQALNKWFKEYAFNVLIQPFHCIIYLVFVQNIYYIVCQSNEFQFGKIIIAVMMFGFMYKAEDIVKSIFGFETTSLGSAALIGAAAVSRAQKTVSTASNVGKLGNVKGAGNKAKEIKQLNKQTPNSLPTPSNGGGQAPNPAPQGGGTGSNNAGGANTNNKNKFRRAIGNVAKGYLKANASAAKYVASHAIGAAIGYGLTGDYKAAEAGASLQKTTKSAIDNARLKHQYTNAKDNVLDAHEQYRQNHQEMTDEQIRNKEQELLSADINTLTDPEERNLAEHLKAYEQVQSIMGQKDPRKSVMDELKNYDEEG